jgi:hypothetical protein
MRRALGGFLLAAAASLSGPTGLAQEAHQFPDQADKRNPYVVEGDAAFSRRQEGRVGAVASQRPIAQAIAAYQTASEAPDNLEARWKLLRALYFKGSYTGLDADGRKAVFNQARRVGDDAIAILARRTGREGGPELLQLSPPMRAEALAKEPDAAPTFFWSAVCRGQWALSVGKLEAARAGAAERIRDDAATVIAIDPKFEDGGGYRILGRLHDQAPEIPFLTGWVSRDEAVKNLRLALANGPRNFLNRHFLAEALARGNAEEKAEAIKIEQALVVDAPSPGSLVENLSVQEDARKDLEAWTKGN